MACYLSFLHLSENQKSLQLFPRPNEMKIWSSVAGTLLMPGSKVNKAHSLSSQSLNSHMYPPPATSVGALVVVLLHTVSCSYRYFIFIAI